MTKSILAVAVVTLAVFGGPVSAQPDDSSSSVIEQVELGALLTARNCGMCHAIGDRGESPNAEAPAFRRLHERMDVDSLGEGLATGILTEHPAMPAFRFSPHEVVAIVRYLRAVQDKRSS
jgi:cytochrome c